MVRTPATIKTPTRKPVFALEFERIQTMDLVYIQECGGDSLSQLGIRRPCLPISRPGDLRLCRQQGLAALRLLISEIYGVRASTSKQTFTPPVGVKSVDVGALRGTLLLAATDGMIFHMAGEAGRHPLPVAALPSEILGKCCPVIQGADSWHRPDPITAATFVELSQAATALSSSNA